MTENPNSKQDEMYNEGVAFAQLKDGLTARLQSIVTDQINIFLSTVSITVAQFNEAPEYIRQGVYTNYFNTAQNELIRHLQSEDEWSRYLECLSSDEIAEEATRGAFADLGLML